MRKQTKIILLTTIVSGVILLIEVLIGQWFPRLTFINGKLTSAYRIVGYFAFSIFILSIPLLFNANKIVTIPLGILVFFIFFVISFFEIHPIDTTTKPIDISVWKSYRNGNKLVAREYKNAKTNRIIQDTVLVKDYFIFRQIIEKRQTTNP